MTIKELELYFTPERLRLLSDVRVVEHDEVEAKDKVKGDVVSVSGRHRVELLNSKLAIPVEETGQEEEEEKTEQVETEQEETGQVETEQEETGQVETTEEEVKE